MTDIKVGDEVRVFDRAGSQPPSGWPGTVTRVGRTLVDISYRGSRAVSFRIDTRRSNGVQYGYGTRFMTLAEALLVGRHTEALKVLSEHRVRLDSGNTLTLEQIEALADLVRSFAKEA